MIKSFVKRLSFLIILPALVLFIYACGPQRPQRTSLYYIGTLKQEGLSPVLETEDDKFRVRSTFLDLTPYVNKKVKIHGEFSQDVFFLDDVKISKN